MFTIKDYIKYYKNTDLSDVSWNVMDNLLCAILVYLPLKTFKGEKNIHQLYIYAMDYKDKNDGVMEPKSYEFLDMIIHSNRYKDLKVSNFTNSVTDKSQFGAATFRIKNETVVTFKGTDTSLIGWIENFRLAYEYPTYTQTQAIEYLKDNVRLLKDNNLYITGHSKGGNLAMVSAFEASDLIFNKIKKVYNFDGPGFKKEQFMSDKYKRLEKKLVNIVPTGSTVGILLNNKKYKAIKTDALAFNEHYPTNWNIFGEYFIKGTLSTVSAELHERTTLGIERLDQEKVKVALETIFSSFEKHYSSKASMSLIDLKNFYNNMKNIDPEIKKYIDTIIDSMVKVSYSKK